jgi:hypothetical protein
MPTYLDLEKSRFGGRPTELYHFYQNITDWFYTSAPFTVITESVETYEPVAIQRGEYEGGGADAPGQMPITLPVGSDLGLHLQAGTIVSPVTLKLYRFHRTAESDIRLIWWGEVVSKDVEAETMTLQLQPLRAQVDLIVPRGLAYRRQCAWNTYDPTTCQVDKAAFTFTGTIASIDGLVIEVPGAGAFAAGFGGVTATFFDGGILTAANLRVGLIDVGDITNDLYTLDERVPGLTVGMAVSLTAGDDRTPETCHDRFDKSERYMAFEKMPLQNPFFGEGLRGAA